MWTSEISSIVVTRIKTECLKQLKNKYPNIQFTTSSKKATEPKFPTVYVQELASPENNSDLEGGFIYSVNSTFQIDVTDNESQNRAKEVMNTVLHIMKKMKYKANALPYFDNSDGTYRCVVRFKRNIDWNDIL